MKALSTLSVSWSQEWKNGGSSRLKKVQCSFILSQVSYRMTLYSGRHAVLWNFSADWPYILRRLFKIWMVWCPDHPWTFDRQSLAVTHPKWWSTIRWRTIYEWSSSPQKSCDESGWKVRSTYWRKKWTHHLGGINGILQSLILDKTIFFYQLSLLFDLTSIQSN